MPEGPVTTGLAHSPDVTVVIAVYNGEETIAACVSSLLAMRNATARVEILIVDNASTDGTREELKAFGDQIRVLMETTRGASAARNCGIRAARGQLVAFTDADCVVEPDWGSELTAPLTDPTIGVVGGQILSLRGANRIARFGERIHDHQRAIEIEDQPYVAAGSWASRRAVLIDTGLFDEKLPRGQDVDLSWRIHQAGYRLVYAPGAVVRHRNEHTIWGLMREGYVHGLNGVRVTNKHTARWPHVQRRWSQAGSRLRRDIQLLARGPDFVDALLGLLFDAGKTAGEFVALNRG